TVKGLRDRGQFPLPPQRLGPGTRRLRTRWHPLHDPWRLTRAERHRRTAFGANHHGVVTDHHLAVRAPTHVGSGLRLPLGVRVHALALIRWQWWTHLSTTRDGPEVAA